MTAAERCGIGFSAPLFTFFFKMNFILRICFCAALGLFVILSLCGCIKSQKEHAAELWREGRLAMSRNDTDRAAVLFRESAEIDPSNVNVHISIQDEMFRKNQEQLAVQTYSELYRKNLNQPWALFLYLRATEPENEKQLIVDALKKHSQSGWLYYRLACLERDENNLAEAEKLFTKALVTDDFIPQGYVELGRIYAGRKDIANAESCFLAAVQLDPLYPEGYFYLGNISLIKGNIDDADDNYSKALKLDSRDDRFGNASAKIDFLRKDYDVALNKLEVLSKKNPRNSRYLISIARIYFMTGDSESALKYLDAAKELNCAREELHLLKVLLYISNNDAKSAEAEFYIAEKFTPNSKKLKDLRELYAKSLKNDSKAAEKMKMTIMEEYLKI